ncbi:MAG: hypothetical protein COA70_01140 [Planctomycetota bacterium]|nr:MAG: hypothetical protein COA70_01140 [Planctomycetota bacterium]
MSRTWLPLTIVVLLIAGFIVFLSPNDSGDDATSGIANPSTKLLPASIEDLQAAPFVDEREKEAEESPSRLTISTPSSRAPIEYATPSEEGLLITVLDGNTQKPLPRAEVMVIDTGVADMRLLESEMSLSADFERVFENLGVIYRTDQNAQVRIPFAVDDHIIAGRTPTHFNFSFDVDKNIDDLNLYLNPTKILRVQIVDHHGNPVKGAPVSLRVRTEKSVQDFTTAYSNEDGFADLKLFQLLLMELADDETYAALLVLHHQPVEVRVHLNELPKEPPVLILPEVGQVEIHVVDDHGEKVTETFLVNMNLLLPEDTYDSQLEFIPRNNFREHLTGRTKNGTAFFPLVDFDQRLHVTVVSQDGERRANAFGGGPVRNGGPAIFTLIPKAERPVIVGRVLNTEGVIGANLSLEYHVKTTSDGGNNSSRAGNIRTDENGKFRLLMEDGYQESAIRVLTLTMRATKKKPKRTTVTDLSYFLAPGENDLGDLVVTVPPLIASGSVVDTSGVPIRGAKVRLQRKYRHGEGPDDFWWNGIWELRTETDREGEFAIRGSLPPDEYRISATHDNFIEGAVKITQGREGILLVLEKSVNVHGSFLLDDGIDPSTLEVTLQTLHPNSAGDHKYFKQNLKDQAKFSFQNMPPGPAILVLRSEIFEEELFLHTDLLLTNQEDTQTLAPIDLRGALQTIRIWVKNPLGELLPKFHIWPSNTRKRHSTQENPFVTITRETGLDFQIVAPGYRSQRLVGVVGDRELTMQSGFVVSAEISNLNRVPNGWKIRLYFKALTGSSGEKADSRLSHQIADFSPTAKPTYFMDSGTYSVRFIAVGDETTGNIQRKWLKDDGTTIQVADLALPQNYIFTFNEDDFAEAIAED